MFTEPHRDYFVRSPDENDAIKLLKSLMPEERSEETEGENRIHCRQCLHVITRPDESITVNGAHHHTFANPHGIVFEIGCFRNAEGCGYAGRPTIEFTWFSGYSWQIAICSKCLLHLGWFFTSDNTDSSFTGLILDRLIYSK